MKKIIVPLLALLALGCIPAMADTGAIVPAGDVKLTEPGQKAIALFNGHEEVLILGTDIAASKDAVALRFIPFPSLPAVDAALPSAFEAAAKLVQRHQLNYVIQYRSGTVADSAVEVVLVKRIPGHEVTVVRINDAVEFAAWVKDYFAKKGVTLAADLTSADTIALDYTTRDFRFFAFDLVDLRADANYVRPVQYRFKTDKLYYPLKTSNTFGGEGRIDLLFCAPRAWQYIRNGFQASTSAKLSSQDLKAVYKDSKAFFKGRDIILQAFRYQGALSFDGDIQADTLNGIKELKVTPPRH